MIYILDDDVNLCNLIAYSIGNLGFEARPFYNPEDMFSAIKKLKPDLIVLDLMLGDEDGIDVLKTLRGNILTEDIAVIILSAKDEEIQMIYGLDCGADDYLPKPFRPSILAAKINAVLRRSRPEKGSLLEYKEISVNLSTRKVLAEGISVSLTAKEFDLLCLFMRKQGKVLSRDYILGTLWGDDSFVEPRIIDSHIRAIRAKLGNSGRYITSIRGVGYCLGAEND